MKHNRVAVDRSVSPSQISFTPSFNLCGLFVDRHIEEGRADKIVARGRAWTLTYGALQTAVCKFGNALKALGIRPGERVMLLAKDTPEFFISFLGAIRIGAVVIPTNTFLRASDYAYMLADSKSKAVIVADSPVDEILPAIEQRGVEIEHRIAIDSTAPDGFLSADLVANASADCPITETTANSPCFWLYSSGSTGSPKASVHEHKDMVYTSESMRCARFGTTENDIIFSAPKLFFAYGIGNSFSFPLWIGCDAILLEDRPTAENTLDMIERFKPTIYFGVPTLYAAQVAAMEKGRKIEMKQHAHLPVRRRATAAGGDGALELAHGRRRARRHRLERGAPHLCAEPAERDQSRLGAAVRVQAIAFACSMPTATMRPEGQPGELVMQGESFAKFYWNKPEKTARVVDQGRLVSLRRHHVSRRRRLFLFLRPRRRHAEGRRHLGVRRSRSNWRSPRIRTSSRPL